MSRIAKVAGGCVAAFAALAAGIWLGVAWHARSQAPVQAPAVAAVARPAPPASAPPARAAEPSSVAALRPFEAVRPEPKAVTPKAVTPAADRPPQRSFEHYPRHSGR